MFIEFYYLLRAVHIPVSITEFLALMDVMAKGMIRSAQDFYHIARALLVKDESDFDAFDDAFMHYFRDADVPAQLKDDLEKWLEAPMDILLAQLQLTPEERDRLQNYDLQELHRLFEERMLEQQEAHQGGNHWIGTQGRSPFGWGGNHPGGIRVGGVGGARSAVQIAQRRHFREYRSDRILDTRQVSVALRKLRKLSKIGAPDVLNLDETIRRTCQLGGEIELVWEKRKKNNLKLLLLMDVGGSMTPFTYMVEQLFS
ncbi:MAG: VWA containing CoxE family protein, partial [Promethearchaeota archaeon]